MKKIVFLLCVFLATLYCSAQNIYYGEPYKDIVDSTKEYLIFFEGDYDVYSTTGDLIDAKFVETKYCIAYIDHKNETFCMCVPYITDSIIGIDSLFTVYEFKYTGMTWGNNWIPIYYSETICGEKYASFAMVEERNLFTIVVSYKNPYKDIKRTIWIGKFNIEDDLD